MRRDRMWAWLIVFGLVAGPSQAGDGGGIQGPPQRWTPPGCEGLVLESPRRWEGSCVREGDTLRVNLRVTDISYLLVRRTSRLPPRLAFSLVAWRFEGFSVQTIDCRGAETVRCKSALHAACEDATFVATHDSKVLGYREVENGSKKIQWPITEVTVTVTVPTQAFDKARWLKLHWVDAYRR